MVTRPSNIIQCDCLASPRQSFEEKSVGKNGKNQIV